MFLAAIAAISACSSGFFAWASKKSQVSHKIQLAIESSRVEQQLQFYATVISECEKLRLSNQDLQKQVMTLQSEVHKLREQLEFYEENHLASEARDMLSSVFNDFIQRPAWIHDVANNKWYLNDAYCREFSVDRKTFWSPVNIFGRYDIESAIQYASNDMKVVESGTTITFEESIRRRIMDPKCDEYLVAKFQKTPFVINSRPYVVGKMLEIREQE